MQPHGELVQRKRGTDAEGRSEHAPSGALRTEPEGQQPDQQDQQDAPHLMVDVDPGQPHILDHLTTGGNRSR